MKKIPADIDRLMWSVAESHDARAVEEFERRFPDHKYELAKRVLMVRELKSAKQPGSEGVATPAFSLREAAPPPARLRFAQIGVAVVVLIFIAGLSYTLTRSALRPDTAARTEVSGGGAVNPQPDGALDSQPEPRRPAATAEPNGPDEVSTKPQAKVTVKIDGAPLSDVLTIVASEAHLQLELAPGMPNPKISMAYTDVDALTVLEDMGKELGFTPLYQGGGKVLIVPVVDPKRKAENKAPAGAVHALEESEDGGE